VCAVARPKRDTKFFQGGISTTAPYFEQTEAAALKCTGCNAPLKSGQMKCDYCGTEFASQEIRVQREAPSNYWV
jgi:hypothetical protein